MTARPAANDVESTGFLASALSRTGVAGETGVLTRWLSERGRAQHCRVEPAPFAALRGWLFEVAEEAIRIHADAFDPLDPVLRNMLDAGGEYAWRVRGEDHTWTPDAIAKLQHATRENKYATYKEYAALINDQSKRHNTFRGLFELRFGNPVPLEEVEPAAELV